MKWIKEKSQTDDNIDTEGYTTEELFTYLENYDYITQIKGHRYSIEMCKEPIELLKRVVKVWREEYPKEDEKMIIEEFGDLGEPCETLNLIEKFLKENE